MKRNTIKRLIMALILTLGGLISLPSYSWPEVDHMNMCGAPAKVVRAYDGNFRSWAAHDNYIAKRGNAYYYRTMCPNVKAVKNYKKAKKRVVRKAKRIARSTKAKSFKRRVKYNEKADCIRVDRMNVSGPAVRVVRR